MWKPALSRSYQIVIVAAGLAALPGMANARPAVDVAKPTIFRCDLADGRVVFSDSRCVGASRVSAWQPPKIAPGLRPGSAKPDMGDAEAEPSEQDVGPALTAELEPYADCRERGGQFRVSARLCILPRKSDELAPGAR